MKKKIMIPLGILLVLFSFVLLASNIIWPWGWGVGAILIIFGLFGDSSTPQNKPKRITANYKNDLSADYEKACAIISKLHLLPSPWKSKNDPEKLKQKILDMKNMTTASIKFSFGESLITNMKIACTKSKDSYRITITGEGKESLEFIEAQIEPILE